MARAETYTWLSLDRWAEIFGINPLHFNGFAPSSFPDQCGQPWYQYNWQDADKLGREGLAEAVAEAEQIISRYLGYDLVPDWNDEFVNTIRPAPPELYGNSYNPRYGRKSAFAGKGHVISGGVRAASLIEAGVAVTRTDEDGDSYDETCTVDVTTDVTDCEIRVFYPGESGAQDWEIRPIEISSTGGVATITFKSWQIPDPDALESLDPDPLDDVAVSYLTTVDVYRVYNDPQTQVQFLWENLPDTCDCGSSTCELCAWSSQYGCLQVRNNRLGIVTYAPGSWDSDDEQWTRGEWTLGREPEKLHLYYYSGYRDKDKTCPTKEMDPILEKVVARLSLTLINRDLCQCNNIQWAFDHWREDLARQGTDRAFQMSFNNLDNPFGTMRGAVYAYKVCNQEGRKIGK